MGCLGYAVPLGPSIEGMGLRRAFDIGMRGTPWMTRGSFISVGSNLAGTSDGLGRAGTKRRERLTAADDCPIVTWEPRIGRVRRCGAP